MRCTAIFPLLCGIAAFILSFLVVFAGHKKNFMEDVNILTLNTSQLGNFNISLPDSLTPSSTSPLGSLESKIVGGLTSLGNDAVDAVAKDLGISDWYSAHLMTYCEGSYKPNGTDRHAHKNISKCSNQTTSFNFNPSKAVADELPDGVTLDDIHWPSAIDDSLAALRVAFKAMFILYIIAIVLTALFILMSAIGVLTTRGGTATINELLGLLAFLALGIASAIVTAIMVKATNAINKDGKEIGLAAYKGTKFLAMTWAATGLLFVASLYWLFECCTGRKRYGNNRRSRGKEMY